MANEGRPESWAHFMCVRFFPTFWTEVKARVAALVIGVVIAALILILQIHYGVIPGNNVHGRLLSILLPYGGVLLAFLLFHLARTPWLISNEHLDTIQAETHAKLAMTQELEELKESPVKMDIKPLEMYRLPSLLGRDRDEHGAMAWDIFVLARIELQQPQFASVLAYSFALSRHGQQNLYAAERDVEQWQLILWNPAQPTAHPMQPLGFDLRSGIPREGWLHFKVDKVSAKTLDESTVWIVADSGRRGVATGEQSAIWNSDQNKRIGRKPQRV